MVQWIRRTIRWLRELGRRPETDTTDIETKDESGIVDRPAAPVVNIFVRCKESMDARATELEGAIHEG